MFFNFDSDVSKHVSAAYYREELWFFSWTELLPVTTVWPGLSLVQLAVILFGGINVK